MAGGGRNNTSQFSTTRKSETFANQALQQTQYYQEYQRQKNQVSRSMSYDREPGAAEVLGRESK
jgi:hypothetical protein